MKNKENLIVASDDERCQGIIFYDSIHLSGDYSKTDDIEDRYSVEELAKLSDVIYGEMLNSAVRHNVAMSSLLEKPNRISVVLGES